MNSIVTNTMKSHKKREEILKAIESGEKWIWIEEVFGCSSSTITRYRRMLGRCCPERKLTEKQVAEIQVSVKKIEELVLEFGVSRAYISKIRVTFRRKNGRK